jgi:hypothetical protein
MSSMPGCQDAMGPPPLSGCTVATFVPQPGADVFETCRQFYICQTQVRTPFSSLIFCEGFLRPIIRSTAARLEGASESCAQPKDRQLPFPWRDFLDILMEVAQVNPVFESFFGPDEVRARIVYLAEQRLLLGRNRLRRLLQTPMRPKRSRFGMQIYPSQPSIRGGVGAPVPILQSETKRWGRVHNVGRRMQGRGTFLQAAANQLKRRVRQSAF